MPYVIGAFIIMFMASTLLLVNAQEVDVNHVQFAINNGLLQYKALDDEWITLINMDQFEGNPGRGIEDISIGENGHLYVSLSDQKLLDLGSIMGTQGPKGDPGISIDTAQISSTGELVISYSDGSESNLGSIIGRDGQDGQDGKSIESLSISNNGDLIISLSDNQVMNIGSIIGPRGVTGPPGPRGLQGVPGEDGTDGSNGLTPTIGENGNWFIGSTDTGTFAGQTTILISDVDDLIGISNCLDCDYKLTQNIDLSSVDWIPIGSATTPFTGTLDGDGFQIINLHSDSQMDNFGLFSQISEGANITDLVLFINSSYTYGKNSGLIASKVDGIDYGVVTLVDVSVLLTEDLTLSTSSGIFFGSINNISLEANSIEVLSFESILSEYNEVGLMAGTVGDFSDIKIYNSSFTSDFVTTASSIGIMFGSIFQSQLNVHSTNVFGYIEAAGGSQIGGLVGLMEHSQLGVYQLNISNTPLSNNRISINDAREAVGGLVGKAINGDIYVYNSDLTIYFRDIQSSQVGGIIGSSLSDNTIHSRGISLELNISGAPEQIGGVVGFQGGGRTELYNSEILLDPITGVTRYLGGVIGQTSHQFTTSSMQTNSNSVRIFGNQITMTDVRPSSGYFGGVIGSIVSNELVSKLAFDSSILDGKSGLFLIYDNEISIIDASSSSNGHCGGMIGIITGGTIDIQSNVVDANLDGCQNQFNGLVVGASHNARFTSELNRVNGVLSGGSGNSDDYLGGIIGGVIGFGDISVRRNTVSLYHVYNSHWGAFVGGPSLDNTKVDNEIIHNKTID